MKVSRKRSTLSCALIAAGLVSMAPILPVEASSADGLDPAATTALSSLEATTGGQLDYSVSNATGNVDFVRAMNGAVLALDNATASPEARALSFLNANAGLFGIGQQLGPIASHPEFAVAKVTQDNIGQTHVRLNQRYEGLEVFGGQLVVHMNDRGITGVNGTFIEGINSVEAAITADEAASAALTAVKATTDGLVEANELMIYPAGLLEGNLEASRLAWAVRVSGPDFQKRIFIDALTGNKIGQISERHESLYRIVYSPDYDPNDPDANVQREEGGSPSPLQPANRLYDFAGQVYELFDNGFGRDSYDGAGAIMRSVYLVNDICPNAYWNSTSTNYCPGFDTDDIVAHEWGHAYTEHTHGLIYSYQSGALNESYSDIFGEIVDLNNGMDGPGVGTPGQVNNNDDPYPDGHRWVIGEDLVVADQAQNSLLTRDMWDPDRLGSPGKVTSSNYACGTADGGGVHTNSGVPNHAFAMLVDGQTYNGQTVEGIGFNRATHIYYRAMTHYQVPSSNFANHADSLVASCADLRNAGTELDDLFTGLPSGESISQSDCDQLSKAIRAVEMRTPPTQCGYEPMLDKNTPPLCDGAESFFTEDFEAQDALNFWTLASNGVNAEWPDYNWVGADNLPGERAGSAAYAINERTGTCAPGGDHSGSFSMDSEVITIPTSGNSSQVRFDHFVETELEFDGGNLLVSVNGAAFELVPEANYLFNGPKTALSSTADGNTNPKAGELAWHGADGGEVTGSWGTTIVDLTGIAEPGQTVQLRYDFGIDGCNGVTGWYVDNVNAYTCSGDGQPKPPAAPFQEPIDAGADQVGGIDRDGQYTISWTYPSSDEAEMACGFRVEEATSFGNLFQDDANELLVAGANGTFSGSAEWHTEAHPSNGTNGYAVLYHDLSESSLVQIAAINVPADGATVLSFDSFEDIEEGYDHGIVQVSVDGGDLELVDIYTGSFSGRREVNLSAYAGQSVRVAFTLVSDEYISFPLFQGWFIDNIAIDSANWAEVDTVSGAARSLAIEGRMDGTYHYRVISLFGADCDEPREVLISNERSIEVQRDGVVTFAPTSSFTAMPNPAEVGEAVAFDGSTSHDNDAEGSSPEIVSYSWSFGDGNTRVTTVPQTSYSYAAAGNYRATLFVTDNDGEQALSETYIEVTDVTEPGTDDKVTGGGHIMVNGQKANFGFNAKDKSGDLSGSLMYQDKANGMKVKADSISELEISGNEATFTAPCSVSKVDGFTCTVTVVDNGEPGANDTFAIEVDNGYSAEGTLNGGNIQIH